MDTIMTKTIGQKVIIVYHSLPLSLRKIKLGVWSFHDRNLYSLVSSLSSLKDQKVIEKHCWVGCPTTTDRKLLVPETEELTEALNFQLKDNSCIPVETINQKLYDDAVIKFSQNFLNPLFHYDISDSTFQDSHWKSYKQFNKRFASKIAEIYQPGDIVWIHGIQLLLVPKYLRELINSCLIGFFLYCPFPAVEIYRCLATRKKILQGILGADLVSFQSYSYSRYFIQSCTRILGVQGGFDGVKYRQERIGKEHLTRVSVFPEGIDPMETQRTLAFPETQSRLAELKARFKDVKIFLAKDQCEAIEATKLKLLAFELFLRNNPSWIGKVVFLLICEPGNNKVLSGINETVARINGEFSRVSFIPIEYISRHCDYDELCALYSVAHVFVSTPLREGMNLDTHDYVSCHRDHNPGILILSEFDGASRCFGGALAVNPWSRSQVANAYLQALTISSEETRLKHEYNLNYVLTNTSFVWGEAFLYDLLSCQGQFNQVLDTAILDTKKLDQTYRLAQKRFLVFDFDVIFLSSPPGTKQATKLSNILKRLSKDSKNIIYIVTSRDKDTLESLLENIPVGLGAEHGNFLKSSTGMPGLDEWKNYSEGIDLSWLETVQPILEFYSERTPGSTVDIRKVTCSWSYQECLTRHAEEQAQELLTQLVEVAAKAPIEIIHANRTIEIKPSGMSNGTAMKKIIDENPDTDFILCMGNGHTDPKLFDLLDNDNPSHFAISIGRVESYTKYYINNQYQVLRILDHISAPSSSSPLPIFSESIFKD